METAVARISSVPARAPERFCLFKAGLVSDIVPAAEAGQQLAADEWADLAAHASEPNAFAEPWFLRAGLRHLAAGQDVRVMIVRNGGLPIGVLPLYVASRYGRMPVRHVQNWRHYHDFLGTPLVRAGQEQLFWSAVLAGLDSEPWLHSFLHVNGLVEHGPVHRGLAAAAWVARRPCDTVHRSARALLDSDLPPQQYYERTVRKKKRKELKRLQARLSELGRVETRRLGSADELAVWCDAFLALEKAGWKGQRGSALACSPETEAFFREALSGALAAGRLEFLRLDLDGTPIAMLVNFLTAPGSFSFKITFDETYARFSPGVLLQIDNLQLLTRKDINWMDSCAVEDHPMINSLWGERRAIVRVTVPLAGPRREAIFRACRAAEGLSAAARHHWQSFRRAQAPAQQDDNER